MKRTMRFLSGVLLSVSFATLSGCGYGGADSPAVASTAASDFSATGFVTSRELTLRPVNEALAATIELRAGTEVAVLERRVDAQLGALVRLGVDRAEADGGTLDIWVRADEFFETDLLPYAPVDEAAEAAEGEEVDALMTYCYRYVKQYLLQIGKVNVYLPGGSAYQAATILPKYGFKRTGRSPASAIENEVCVYGGGPAGHGHIEVKRGGKWWYGYGFKSSPIANRKFLGCFYK